MNAKFSQTFILLIGFFILFTPMAAQANLGLTPTRIVFEDGDRFANVTLLNTDDKAQTFEITWRFFAMNATGTRYRPVEESNTEFDVSEFVFFTPRRVTIPAGKVQRIRLAFRRPKDVPPGDYHAHLQFSPVAKLPDAVALSGDGGEPKMSAGVGVKVGYSIPVIIRAGNIDEGAEIGQVVLTRNDLNKLVIEVPLTRKAGPYGVFGHLYVYHKASDDAPEELIAEVANASIYPEIGNRLIDFPIPEETKSGQIRVLLRPAGNETEVMAEEIFPLQ